MEKWKAVLDLWERFLERPRSAWSRYGLMTMLLCGLLWMSIEEGTRPHVPMSFLYLAVAILSALYGGFGPGLIAALVSAMAVDYFYFEPVGQILNTPASVFLFVGMLLLGGFLSLLTASLKEAYQRAKREQRVAEESTRAREHTLAVVSHDLRQPLTMISLQMQLLLRQGHLDAAEKTLRSVAQMQRLIQDLLDASRVEAGTFPLKLERRDIVDLIEELLESFLSQAELRQITLELRGNFDRPFDAAIDGVRLRQALSNILENAIKFTPEGGTVRVSLLHPDADEIEIQVRDSGPGILRENLTRIFERNWQARETAHMGTGLGLFIARGIVQAHHGRIWVESEVGRGAVFRIRIPIAPAALTATG